MGLDMYLTKKVYVGANFEHNKVEGTVALTTNGKPIPVNLNRVTYIEENVGYWRKANAIHKWFVDNCQDGEDDCRDAYVDTDDMQELLALCEHIKETARLIPGKIHTGTSWHDGITEEHYQDGQIIENAEEIASLLPTQSGCFFGGTDYDEGYMQDIDGTIKILKDALADPSGEFYYNSSW